MNSSHFIQPYHIPFFLLLTALALLPSSLCLSSSTALIRDRPLAALPTRAHRSFHLTFDDGPSALTTPHILDLLRQANVTATFFLVGMNIDKLGADNGNENGIGQDVEKKSLIQRILREGHFIGSHTYSHFDFRPLNAFSKTPARTAVIRRQLNQFDDLLASLAGPRPLLYRAPYGGFIEDEEFQSYIPIGWHWDSGDWEAQSAQEIIDHIRAGLDVDVDGLSTSQRAAYVAMGAGIALFHELPNTLQALPAVLSLLADRGYEAAPLSEFLNGGERRRLYAHYDCQRVIQQEGSKPGSELYYKQCNTLAADT